MPGNAAEKGVIAGLKKVEEDVLIKILAGNRKRDASGVNADIAICRAFIGSQAALGNLKESSRATWETDKDMTINPSYPRIMNTSTAVLSDEAIKRIQKEAHELLFKKYLEKEGSPPRPELKALLDAVLDEPSGQGPTKLQESYAAFKSLLTADASYLKSKFGDHHIALCQAAANEHIAPGSRTPSALPTARAPTEAPAPRSPVPEVKIPISRPSPSPFAPVTDVRTPPPVRRVEAKGAPVADASKQAKAELYLKAKNEDLTLASIQRMLKDVTRFPPAEIDKYAAKYDKAVTNYRSEHSGKTIQDANDYFRKNREKIVPYEQRTASPSPAPSMGADLSDRAKALLSAKGANPRTEQKESEVTAQAKDKEHHDRMERYVEGLSSAQIKQFAKHYDKAVANYLASPAHSGETRKQANTHFMKHPNEIKGYADRVPTPPAEDRVYYRSDAPDSRAPSASPFAPVTDVRTPPTRTPVQQREHFRAQTSAGRASSPASYSPTTGSIESPRPRATAVTRDTFDRAMTQLLGNTGPSKGVVVHEDGLKQDCSWKLQVKTQHSEATIACAQNKTLKINDLNIGDPKMIDMYIRSIQLMAKTAGFNTPVQIKIDHLPAELAIALHEGAKRVGGIEVTPRVMEHKHEYKIGDKTHPKSSIEPTHYQLGSGEPIELPSPSSAHEMKR